MPERSRIHVRIEHDIPLVRQSGKGVVCDDHNASPPLLCHIHKVDCDWMGLSETHRQDDVTSAATRHPRHIRLRSVTYCPRIRPQQLHQVGGMLHHGSRFMKCYSYHATGFSQCGHRTVEGIQSVLGDGLLQTQPIGTEAPGENILLNHKQKLIVMDYRPGVRSQSMLVTNSLLKGRISTESQRLRKPDNCRTRRVAMARKLVSTEISRLFQVVNYVARYSLLGLREGVEAIGQKVGYSLGLGVAHPTSMLDTGLHHSHNTTSVANLLPRASKRR